MDKVKLILYSISEMLGVDDLSLLTLLDDSKKRQLAVVTDKTIANKISMFMMNKPEGMNLFPKVVADIFCPEGSQQLSVLISDVKGGEYQTEIIDEQSGKHYPIRCSDGILFSLVCKVQLYTTVDMMNARSIPFQFGGTKIGLPLTIMNDKLLEESMQMAIDSEDYEMACNLRDELKKRHTPKEQK